MIEGEWVGSGSVCDELGLHTVPYMIGGHILTTRGQVRNQCIHNHTSKFSEANGSGTVALTGYGHQKRYMALP